MDPLLFILLITVLYLLLAYRRVLPVVTFMYQSLVNAILFLYSLTQRIIGTSAHFVWIYIQEVILPAALLSVHVGLALVVSSALSLICLAYALVVATYRYIMIQIRTFVLAAYQYIMNQIRVFVVAVSYYIMNQIDAMVSVASDYVTRQINAIMSLTVQYVLNADQVCLEAAVQSFNHLRQAIVGFLDWVPSAIGVGLVNLLRRLSHLLNEVITVFYHGYSGSSSIPITDDYYNYDPVFINSTRSSSGTFPLSHPPHPLSHDSAVPSSPPPSTDRLSHPPHPRSADPATTDDFSGNNPASPMDAADPIDDLVDSMAGLEIYYIKREDIDGFTSNCGEFYPDD